MVSFEYTCNTIPKINKYAVSQPLPDNVAQDLLLSGACHIDHEGYDLNEIEQAYYEHNNIQLNKDNTWYKDGGQNSGTNAILQSWFIQTSQAHSLVLDHSHFVFKYPIVGAAREQLLSYATKRPELYRILSVNFKCGLDLCIDYYNTDRVEPIVHIEWDYETVHEMLKASKYVETIMSNHEWANTIPTIIRYNDLARKNKIDAFKQADTRAMILLGHQSYKLIPTL